MARDFPSIVNFGSAFRFALEAERAGADFAAAAGVIAPDPIWQAKFEELLCAHDDRVEKLTTLRRQIEEGSLEPLRGFDGSPYAAILGGEPAATWPAAGEQMAAVEDTIADCHEAFVTYAGEALGDQARAFAKAGTQARAAAEELRGLLV